MQLIMLLFQMILETYLQYMVVQFLFGLMIPLILEIQRPLVQEFPQWQCQLMANMF